MQFRRHRRESLQISITPMIDVVFLLLIFFMVTTTFHRETELQVQLPEAHGEETADQKTLEVIIDANGNYSVNTERVVNNTLETLKQAMRLAAGKAKTLPMIISADKDTPHQFVIRALDAASQLGFVRISFAAEKPSD